MKDLDHTRSADWAISEGERALKTLQNCAEELRAVFKKMSDEELIAWLLTIRDWKK